MYRHILVAIDDSRTSRRALDEAIAIAKLSGGTLEIAHAVDESLVHAFTTHGAALADARQLEKALINSGETILDDAVNLARQAGLEPKKRLVAAPDMHAADQVAKAVGDSGADLLVVGSHGRRGFRRLLLGSVAENLVRKVAVSVLLVRGHD